MRRCGCYCYYYYWLYQKWPLGDNKDDLDLDLACVRACVWRYLSSVSQHGVFGLGQLLSADDLQDQLLLHLARQGVLQVGVKGTWSRGHHGGEDHRSDSSSLPVTANKRSHEPTRDMRGMSGSFGCCILTYRPNLFLDI